MSVGSQRVFVPLSRLSIERIACYPPLYSLASVVLCVCVCKCMYVCVLVYGMVVISPFARHIPLSAVGARDPLRCGSKAHTHRTIRS